MGNPDADFDALMAEMGQLQTEIDAANGWDLDSQLSQAMDALQCPDPDSPVTHLSGGEKRRVALCRLLLEAPDLLLLDEPTNHLDAESVLWLEKFLHDYPGAVMAVTHDRYFLDDVAEWICEVDRGQLYPYEGNYSTYLENKAARLEAQNQQDAKRAKKMRAELEWVRSSPKARQAKNRARLDRYEQMEHEIMLMKRANINHVRTSHYPNDPYFYYLCNKYGIYLESEANIESHEYFYGKASLSHVPEFQAAHVDRVMAMTRSWVTVADEGFAMKKADAEA